MQRAPHHAWGNAQMHLVILGFYLTAGRVVFSIIHSPLKQGIGMLQSIHHSGLKQPARLSLVGDVLSPANWHTVTG